MVISALPSNTALLNLAILNTTLSSTVVQISRCCSCGPPLLLKKTMELSVLPQKRVGHIAGVCASTYLAVHCGSDR